jgi:ABC-type glycerol-3-phosphate transport system permease component
MKQAAIREKGERSLKFTAYFVTLFFTVVSLFPLFWMISSSFKDSLSLISYPPKWLPKVPQEVTVVLNYDTSAVTDRKSSKIDAMKATWFPWKKFQNEPIGEIRVIGVRNHHMIYESKTVSSNFSTGRQNIVPNQFFSDQLMRGKISEIENKKYSVFTWYGDSGQTYQPVSGSTSLAADAPAFKIGAFLKSVSWLSGAVTQTTQKNNYWRLFENYRALWRISEVLTVTTYSFQHFFMNSVSITSLVIIAQLLVGGLAGYTLSHLLSKRWANFWTMFFIATIMIPEVAILVPLYITVQKLHLTGTLWGIILPHTSWGIVIFLFKGFFEQLPRDLIQSARIDGASEFQIFYKLIVPLSFPIFTVISVMVFLPVWNEILLPLVIAGGNSAVWTIPVYTNAIQQSPLMATSMNLVMALLVASTLPMLLVFIFCQGLIEKGIAWTGIKG